MTPELANAMSGMAGADAAFQWYVLAGICLVIMAVSLGWSILGNTGKYPLAFIVATTAGGGSTLLLVTCILAISRFP